MSSSKSTETQDALFEEVRQAIANIPYISSLGVELQKVESDKAELRMPHRDDLVGDAGTGILHGGVISSMLDCVSATAYKQASNTPDRLVTLDLRIDYQKPATPGKDVIAAAHCYKVTKTIGFVRGIAYHEDVDDPIATSVATFMTP